MRLEAVNSDLLDQMARQQLQQWDKVEDKLSESQNEVRRECTPLIVRAVLSLKRGIFRCWMRPRIDGDLHVRVPCRLFRS